MKTILNNIYKKQTQPEMVKLLQAQKQLYIEGKRGNLFILVISFFTSLIFPAFVLAVPQLNSFGIVVSAILVVLIELYFQNVPQEKAKRAANIQEQFDTELFGMEWNEGIAGNPEDELDIHKASIALDESQKSNVKEDAPWYGDYSSSPHAVATLLCQKENLYWDKEQKNIYTLFISLLIFLSLVIALAFGFIIYSLSPLDVLIQVLVPLLPLEIQLFKSLKRNERSEWLLEHTLARVNELLQDFQKSEREPTEEELRSIQNNVYKNRRNGTLIPESFYNFFRGRLEKVVQGQSRKSN